MPKKFAIIAALDHELHPLEISWPLSQQDSYPFHESPYAVAVCGGFGADAATDCDGVGAFVEGVGIVKYSPDLLISAGVAGALVADLQVGATIFPATVIDSQDTSRHETAIQAAPVGNTAVGRTILITFPEVATVPQKQQLAKSYGAPPLARQTA